DIYPYFKHNSINVVYATDKNYLPYCIVSIQSLMDNSSDNFNYEIYILFDGSDDDLNNFVAKINSSKLNFHIRIVNVKNYISKIISDSFFTRSYFSVSMYYRIFIPQIFKNFRKILYIDCDTIVCKDVAELFSISLDEKMMGAVRDVVVILSLRRQEKIWEKEISRHLLLYNLKNYLNYFNSGVLLYDISKCLYNKLTENCINALLKLKNPHFPDQDILNIVSQDQVKFISQEWNMQWTIALYENELELYLPNDIVQEFNIAKTSPKIIHFISETKPWNSPMLEYSDKWWRYAYKSFFYGEILCKNYYNDFKVSIFEMLKTVEVVSFDLFDTLLIRPYIMPKDVFLHIEKNFESLGFAEARINAEYVAAQTYNKDLTCITFDEIYSVMEEHFIPLKQQEQELELQTIYINPEIKAIMEHALKLNKRVVFTSDMYYDKNFIKKILDKNNINGYEKIYLSGELGVSKFIGNMFGYICADLNVVSTKILHIGDNIKSDYQNSIQNNFHSFHCVAPKELFFKAFPRLLYFYNQRKDDVSCSIILGLLIKKWIISGKIMNDYWAYFGYFYGGVLAYGLSEFTYSVCIKNSLKEFIFIARDGYVIKKIFNMLQKHFHTEIKTKYIYASRAINLIVNLSIDSENSSWENKINSILNLYQSEISELKTIDLDNLTDDEKKQLFLHYFNDLKKISKAQQGFYKNYISKMNLKEEKIGLFDMATSEFSCVQLLNAGFEESKLFIGCFFVVVPNERYKNINVVSNQYSKNRYFKNSCIGEFLISAPELPVKNISKEKKIIRIDNANERNKVDVYRQISLAEIQFSKDLLDTFGKFKVSFDSDVVIDLIDNFTENPYDIDLYYFNNIYHSGSGAHDNYQK
ncbi:TPA: glycosyltransferase, partial [Campylobacter jejuni]